MRAVAPIALAAVFVATFATACGARAPDLGSPDGGSADSGTNPDASSPPDSGDAPRFLTTLANAGDLATLTSTAGGGVKYLARIEGRPAFEPLTEACYFQNMRRYPWHLEFLRSFPEHTALAYDAYLALVLKRPSRRFWGGAIQAWAGAIHPVTARPGVLAYTVYSEPNGITADDLVSAHMTLAPCIPFASALLVYVPESPDQRALVIRERANLLARGVPVLFPEELVRGISHQVYSSGEGYGYLRVVPIGESLEEYGPQDVVIVESAPNDISVVAGMITKNPQNVLGHVNLRLREKGIPNAAAPRIYEADWIGALEDALVHVVANDTELTIEPADLAAAEAFWEAHRPQVPQPSADLTVVELRDFRELRSTDRTAFGAKAANLGELRHVLDPPAVNDGFAIPLSRYQTHADAIGVTSALEVLLADPRFLTDAQFKRHNLDLLRKSIRREPFPAELLDAIEAQALATFGENARTLKLRFRSSTNVEDLELLTGAGLYESKSGCIADDRDGDQLGPSHCLTAEARADLERRLADRQAELEAHPERTWLAEIISDLQGDLTEEKPVADAVRKVWASLFTDRAFDERAYYGIDHRRAFMAIAVNPSFQVERLSGVVVTNLRPDAGLPLYRVNSQAGDVSVVRPEDPLAISELFTFRRDGNTMTELAYQTYSSLVPPETPLWPDAAQRELARLLFIVQDHFQAEVYPSLQPARFDLEVKLTAGGDVVLKQIRPYVSQDPSGQ